MNGINGVAHPGFHRGDAEWLALALSALADPTRLRIIAELHGRDDATGVQVVAAIGNKTQPTIAHHLKILLAVGLVSREHMGVFSYWSLNRDALRAVLDLARPGGKR